MQEPKPSHSISTSHQPTVDILLLCPHCGQNAWVKISRSLLQRILHPNKNLCFCRNCRQRFWRPKDIF